MSHEGHDHGGHAGHSHGVSADADHGKLAIALALIAGFMVVEVVVGIASSSLALLSDAAHMLSDAGALALALVALRLARRPAGGNFTFGLKRAEILSAQFNGATLAVLGAVIFVEGVRRLFSPPDVPGLPLLVVALVGVVVNLVATWTLARANRQSLNIEGAYQHILTDLAAFVATAIAGVVILLTGFTRADGVAALIIAVIMFRAAYGLLRDSGRILLEAAPAGLDPEQVGEAMAAVSGVVQVHDLHLWEVSSGFPSLAAHVLVGEEDDCHARRREVAAMLHERFGVDHVTLQMDHAQTRPLQVEPCGVRARPSGRLRPG
ncbi:MAG: cation transporter [Actinobacteria bacterium]|nr:cation transporter [Actinomycetota bacterium]OJU86145.1 MAG: cation transporter [Solirubrobacterales bacterium 70-9]